MSLAPSFESIEIDRLRAHFDLVGVLLRAQPTEGVDVEARERTLALIEAYADRGVFPRNEIDPTRMLPSFVDAVGTRCAVAFLMEETEARPLVERIRRRFNASYVAEMLGAFGTAIGAWAASVGLRPHEVALVQPDYCYAENASNGNQCIEYRSIGGPHEGCEEVQVDDGTICCFGDEGCTGAETGVCEDGRCVPKDEGCVVSTGTASSSLVPALAALILLAAQRRAFRVRDGRDTRP